MPILYLSPSTQENNFYVTGGSEEQYMNLVADRMVPYLDASGIRYVRNTPDMTAGSSIVASNQGNYDLHLALHSNAAPEGRYGTVRGSIVFYFPGSALGKSGAELFANNLRAIYPLPNLVQAVSTTVIGEVTRVRAPTIFLELAFHDNVDDANWITNNLELIARNLVLSTTEFFGLPFLSPVPSRQGVVDISYGALNLRERPSLDAPILSYLPDKTQLNIINQWQDWYLVNASGNLGYVKQDFVTLI